MNTFQNYRTRLLRVATYVVGATLVMQISLALFGDSLAVQRITAAVVVFVAAFTLLASNAGVDPFAQNRANNSKEQ